MKASKQAGAKYMGPSVKLGVRGRSYGAWAQAHSATCKY